MTPSHWITAGATNLAFASIIYLLSSKRIDSNNTLFFACVIVLLYIVAVAAALPTDADDKIIMGLISIGSAIVGFLSRGLVVSGSDTNRNGKSE